MQTSNDNVLLIQGNEAGAIEIHMNDNEFYLKECHGNDRGTFFGQVGKDGIWTIHRNAGESPELVVFFRGTMKFNVKFSNSLCPSSSWGNFWKKEAYLARFHSADTASVRFRNGNPGT